MGGGTAFGGRTGSQNDFSKRAFFNPLNQSGNPQFIGANAPHRRKVTQQDMIKTVKQAGFFDGINIERFLDHTDFLVVAVGTGTNFAGVDGTDIVANRAINNFFPGLNQPYLVKVGLNYF